jgi:hypothetical protein
VGIGLRISLSHRHLFGRNGIPVSLKQTSAVPAAFKFDQVLSLPDFHLLAVIFVR